MERVNGDAGMVFGYRQGNPLWLKTDRHILVIGSTRSGKGTTLLIPHLLRYPGSAFVLDPKGENARATWRQRARLNDTCHALDPFGIAGKPPSRLNPLARFTPGNMEEEANALAAALVFGEGATSDHWTASAQQLVAALIMWVYASPEVTPESKDLPYVRHVLLSSAQATLDDMFRSDDIANGLLADLAQSFLATPPNELGSIISTAQRQTAILDNRAIGASLAASGPGAEVNFADWHRGTMTVYLCLSAPRFPVYNRWLRLILTAALNEMTDALDPPALPVSFVLDELATLRHLDLVSNAVGLAAGYGVQLISVFQDIPQMKDCYGTRWASFVGNAGICAVFAVFDEETARYWSQFMGEKTDLTQERPERRPLMTPDEVMLEFAFGRMLVLAFGAEPAIARRVPYYEDRTLDGLWDDPRARP